MHYVASQAEIPGVSELESNKRLLEAARRAVEIDPNNAEPYWLVGVSYAQNGQP